MTDSGGIVMFTFGLECRSLNFYCVHVYFTNCRWLQILNEYGICVIKDAPTAEREVEKVQECNIRDYKECACFARTLLYGSLHECCYNLEMSVQWRSIFKSPAIVHACPVQ